jgi:hypothetical protein
MTVVFAKRLLIAQVVLLMIGTQMPGSLREAVLLGMNAPSFLSSWAHFGLFAGMALVAYARPLSLSAFRLLLQLLCLALLSEAMQTFALGRHPRWIDVGIDMGGAIVGLTLVAVGRLYERGNK